jgi:DNA-binding transcriptional ArsR family regulator
VPGLTEVFAALADPTRRAVMASLTARDEVTASGLAAELPMSRQAVAKHLATLERAGLVAPRREGRETRYRLTPEPLESAMAWMGEVGGAWDARLGRLERLAARPGRDDGA